MTDIAVPHEPLQIALIGAGNRARTIYRPLFKSLRRWIQVVAVCDPVTENADWLAEQLGAPAFYDIRALARSGEIEAALVVTPVESHHSISVLLSGHRIHNLCETTWCSTVSQGREMIETARAHGVIVRVAENFFRMPIDRFAVRLKSSGYIGPIERVFSYGDHTGYHNNSRWITFAGAHPLWVQSIEHAMPTAPFFSLPHRFHDRETFLARYFMFPDNLLVSDQAANVKGFLGRHPRPGYTEWHGRRGTLVHNTSASTWWPSARFIGQARRDHQDQSGRTSCGSDSEIRFCSDAGAAPDGRPVVNAAPDVVSSVCSEFDGHVWTRTFADTPAGRIEYVNPLRPIAPVDHPQREYGSCVMGHIVDFALAVRGLATSELSEHDALMSLMMEVGARESARQDGRRIPLPIAADTESDAAERARLRERYGVDPMDVEAMLGLSYPRP